MQMNERIFNETDCGRIYGALSRSEKSKCIIYLSQNVGDSIFTWMSRLPTWARGKVPNKMKPLELEKVYQIFENKEWR